MFIENNTYIFTENPKYIEENKTFEINPNQHYLGKFIKYLGIPYVVDWLSYGKAIFENGTVCLNSYKNVVEYITTVTPLDTPSPK
jgi:hypothetical protein